MRSWLVPSLFLLACGVALLRGAPSAVAAESAAPAAAARPRLAVVCLDDAERTTTLADLVQAELLAGGKVELVERAEFARILAEQKFSAAGLTSGASQIAVGKILRADALLLLERDRKAKEFRVRLTDTLYAAQLCRMTVTNQDAATPEAASTLVCRAVFAALPKLAVPLAQRLLVTVIEVRNGTMSKDAAWVETEVPALLETALVREPRVFVLDRQRIRELAREVENTAGGITGFATGAVLVDGDVALKPDVPLGSGPAPVVLTVRFRGSDLTEIGRVRAESTLDKVRELVPRVQADVVKRIAALGPQKPMSVETEKRLLDAAMDRALADSKPGQAVVLAEAARGLDVTDPKTLNNLLNTLFREVGSPDLSSPERVQKAVDAVLRACELTLLLPAGTRYGSYYMIFTQLSSVLGPSALLRLSAEQRAQLRPVRKVLRQAAEAGFPDQPSVSVTGSITFCEDPVERDLYINSLIERTLDPAKTPPAVRARRLAEIFSNSPYSNYSGTRAGDPDQVQAFLDPLSRHEDCVARFFASRELVALAENKAQQSKYVKQAVAALPDVLARDDLFAKPFNMELYHPLAHIRSLREWAENHGADIGEAVARISRLYHDMLDRKEFVRYALTYPHLVLRDLPPADAIGLIDQAAALCEELDRTAPFVRRPDKRPVCVVVGGDLTRIAAGTCLAASARLRVELANLHDPAMAVADGPGRKVLLCMQSPAWKSIFAEACRKWDDDPATVGTYPAGRLLVDGDTVWIAFNARGVLLVQLDLATRRILRTWMGPKKIPVPWLVYPTVLCRWGDAVCLAAPPMGVWICEGDAKGNVQVTEITQQHGGLLDPQVSALAAAGDDLYIGAASGLWRYSRKTATTELLASNRQETVGAVLPQGFTILGLKTNRNSSRVYVVGMIGSNTHFAMFRFTPATKELTDLTATPLFPPPLVRVAQNGKPPPSWPPPVFLNRMGPDVLYVLDAEAEKLAPEREALPPLPADLDMDMTSSGVCNWQFNMVRWQDDVLAIRKSSGSRETWSVEQFSGSPAPVAAAPAPSAR